MSTVRYLLSILARFATRWPPCAAKPEKNIYSGRSLPSSARTDAHMRDAALVIERTGIEEPPRLAYNLSVGFRFVRAMHTLQHTHTRTYKTTAERINTKSTVIRAISLPNGNEKFIVIFRFSSSAALSIYCSVPHTFFTFVFSAWKRTEMSNRMKKHSKRKYRARSSVYLSFG